MGQLNLYLTRARRTRVKERLTPHMQARLVSEESSHDKIRARDCSNALLASNTDALVKEEMKSTFSLRQVVKGYGGGSRKHSPNAADSSSSLRPVKRTRLESWEDNSRNEDRDTFDESEAQTKPRDAGLGQESSSPGAARLAPPLPRKQDKYATLT